MMTKSKPASPRSSTNCGDGISRNVPITDSCSASFRFNEFCLRVFILRCQSNELQGWPQLTEADLDTQMDEIGKEEAALEAQIAELSGRIAEADSIGSTISSAQALLERLWKRLDEPISWGLERRLIEVLVAGVRVETVEETGVKQSRITVTYRFSQPDQPMPIVLPQSYSTGRVVRRIPAVPQTVGDHIRRKRLSLKMLQREAAERLSVVEASIWNWEANTAQPDLRFMSAVIQFLGYNPLLAADTLNGRLIRHRTSLGMTQEEAAKSIGVDPNTLTRWERDERKPTGIFPGRVKRFLKDEGASDLDARRVG
jgi:transcriptional regulator with XRE-family HTH domain